MPDTGLHLEEDDIRTMLRAFTTAMESLTDVAREHPRSPARLLYDSIAETSRKVRAYARSLDIDEYGGRYERPF